VREVANHVLNVAEIEVGVGFAKPDGITDKDGATTEMDTEIEGKATESG